MEILFDVIITLVEALFLLIPLKKVKNIKSKSKIFILYLGIFISIIISSLLLNKSIFKYFTMPLIIFFIMKLLLKDTIFVIINMLYSDMKNAFGDGNDEESLKRYLQGTNDWYFDEDAEVDGEEKLFNYKFYVVK